MNVLYSLDLDSSSQTSKPKTNIEVQNTEFFGAQVRHEEHKPGPAEIFIELCQEPYKMKFHPGVNSNNYVMRDEEYPICITKKKLVNYQIQ